ncbi:MAG: energy transducer TonB [Chitinophagales bacterium]|nr:energy transducer TonB [Chitinophagales bacterium]
MKFPLIIFLFLVLPDLKAQQADSVYSYVEIMPEYPGGEAAFLKHLRDSLNYPAIDTMDALDFSGKTIVRFVVNEDGSSSDFQILRSSSKQLDNAIVNSLKSLSHFKPGMQNGKPVKVYYIMPLQIHIR